jgi:hypothetical protein
MSCGPAKSAELSYDPVTVLKIQMHGRPLRRWYSQRERYDRRVTPL